MIRFAGKGQPGDITRNSEFMERLRWLMLDYKNISCDQQPDFKTFDQKNTPQFNDEVKVTAPITAEHGKRQCMKAKRKADRT